MTHPEEYREVYVICDLDGTLAKIEHRRHFVESKKPKWDVFYEACDKDTINTAVKIALEGFRRLGYKILIFSGRSEVVRNKTEQWLKKYWIGYTELKMRPENDYTPDEILKATWLEEYDIDNILCVIDDRNKVVKMWRDKGLTCFQVDEGNF